MMTCNMHAKTGSCNIFKVMTSRGLVKEESLVIITKTRLYSFNPLKPCFYTVKLGFTGVYIIFLIFAQKQSL